MKKIRILLAVSSVLLVSCGEKEYEILPQKNNAPVCEHNFVWEEVDDEFDHLVCKECGKEQQKTHHNFKKDLERVADNREPNCADIGWEFQICDKCGASKRNEIPAAGHDFSVVKFTTAICTEDGENTMVCSRCGVEDLEKQPQEALGHQWVADTSYVGLAASCKGAGTAREKCTRCNETQIVEVPALGHDYKETIGTKVDGYATLTTGTCKRECSGKRVYWSASDVNTNCKTQRQVKGELEPNYVVVDSENGGIRFYGRAIHNAQNLKAPEHWISGNLDSYFAPVYDATIEGSFFEYTINLPDALRGVQLVADMRPSTDMNATQEVFKNIIPGDPTPGLVDSLDNKYQFRYIVSIDGNEITQYDFIDTPNRYRGWYMFSHYHLNLDAGEHTIKITMAGGHLATFYNIGFEKVTLAG